MIVQIARPPEYGSNAEVVLRRLARTEMARSISGPILAGGLVEGILALKAAPICVDCMDDSWWLVEGARDWLASDSTIFDPFFIMRAFPELGINACRPEAYVYAFSRTVVSIATPSGCHLIKGQKDDELQRILMTVEYQYSNSRLVVFHYDGKQTAESL